MIGLRLTAYNNDGSPGGAVLIDPAAVLSATQRENYTYIIYRDVSRTNSFHVVETVQEIARRLELIETVQLGLNNPIGNWAEQLAAQPETGRGIE